MEPGTGCRQKTGFLRQQVSNQPPAGKTEASAEKLNRGGKPQKTSKSEGEKQETTCHEATSAIKKRVGGAQQRLGLVDRESRDNRPDQTNSERI